MIENRWKSDFSSFSLVFTSSEKTIWSSDIFRWTNYGKTKSGIDKCVIKNSFRKINDSKKVKLRKTCVSGKKYNGKQPSKIQIINGCKISGKAKCGSCFEYLMLSMVSAVNRNYQKNVNMKILLFSSNS